METMQKYGNTLKMMGVSSKDALFFQDACYTLRHHISLTTRQNARETILNTKVMDKTIKEWFIDLTHDKNYPFDNIEFINVVAVIELVLQKYYYQTDTYKILINF